jgi:LPS export ABC transporter protein LptC
VISARGVISIGLILLLPCLFSGCSDLSDYDKQQIEEALADSLLNVTESWDIAMRLMEDEQLKVKINGRKASTYSDSEQKETVIEGPVHISVFDSTGVMSTTVNCDRAIYYSTTSSFEFFGDVRVHTKDDRRMRSTYLKWTRNDNLIQTDKFVTIITPSDSLTGTGFEGTTDLEEYTITHPSGDVTVD